MANRQALPKATTSRARSAATFIQPIPEDLRNEAARNRRTLEQFDVEDREWIVRIMLAGWWDNGESLQDKRFTGSAESTYNFANQPGWRDIPTLNVVPATAPRNFILYASRTS